MKSFQSLKQLCCLGSSFASLRKAPAPSRIGTKRSPVHGKILFLFQGRGLKIQVRIQETLQSTGRWLSSAVPWLWFRCGILQLLRVTGSYWALSKLHIVFHCCLVTDLKAGIRKYATVLQEMKLFNFLQILSYILHLNFWWLGSIFF